MSISEVKLGDCLDFMREMPDNFADLAIVDPPYGINAPNMTMGSNPNRKDMQGGTSVAQKLKKNRLNQGAGKLKDRALQTMAIEWDYEPPTKLYFNELFRVSINQVIWGGNNSETKIHPTQKPVALYKWLLQNYANDGDKILDTHLGSGSSRIACYDLGFDFYGYELDKDYFEAQEKRFANHIAQPRLIENPVSEVKQEELFN